MKEEKELKETYKPAEVHWTEVEELACHILGMSEDSESDEIDKAIAEKFDCSMETFENIVSHLLPLAASGGSELTGEQYRGFLKPLGNGAGLWIIKQKLKVNSKKTA